MRERIMEIISDGEELRAYRRFLEEHPAGHFLQTPEWARVKQSWKNETVLARDREGRITGSMSLLIRRLPLFGELIYCPRGPVCDPKDRETLQKLTGECRELMKKYGAFAVRIEPDVPEGETDFLEAAEALGWRRRPAKDALDELQPANLFRLKLEGKSKEEVFSGFHKKLRYNIRLAQRRGVKVTEGSRDDLEDFGALMDVTARRDGFLARDTAYFRKIWDSLGPERVSLLMARHEGRTLAAGLFVSCAHKTWYLYGASSDENRNLMPCHLLQWEAIRRAMARGDRLYDLRGCLGSDGSSGPGAGLYRFKSQFGADKVRLVGELYLTDRPIKYALARKAERLVRLSYRLRSKLRSRLGR